MEAGLYRYESDSKYHRGVTPADEYNHALGALRYMISRLDARKMARRQRSVAPSAPDSTPAQPAEPAKPKKRPWFSIYNEALWTRIY